MAVVAEAATAAEAIALTEQHRPAILIVDLKLPDQSGLEVVARVARTCPETRVILLSMYSGDLYVHEALARGVRGYVLKDSQDRIVDAVRHVHAGGRWLSPSINEQVLEAFARRRQEQVLDPYAKLTGRERQIVRLIGGGHTIPEVSRQLGISMNTATYHVRNVYVKLGVHTVEEIRTFAKARGLGEAPPKGNSTGR